LLNNFYGVESKNTDAYIRERKKRNKNVRYTMNVIYTFSFVVIDVNVAEFQQI
jgi:hypothetical protein